MEQQTFIIRNFSDHKNSASECNESSLSNCRAQPILSKSLYSLPADDISAGTGAEQSQFSQFNKNNSNGKFEIHMNTMGWIVSKDHYNKWKKNVGNSFVAPAQRIAPMNLYDINTHKWYKNPNGGKTRLISTAVYGRTIFWKTN